MGNKHITKWHDTMQLGPGGPGRCIYTAVVIAESIGGGFEGSRLGELSKSLFRITALPILALALMHLACAPVLSGSVEFGLPVDSSTGQSLPQSTDNVSILTISPTELGGFNSSGNPALPCEVLYVALPPHADPSSVCIKSPLSTTTLPGRYEVPPVPPIALADGDEFWGHDKQIGNGRNQLVYSADAFYPTEHIRVREVGQIRTWKVAVVEYWPYAHNPVSGELRAVTSRTAEISFTSRKSVAGLTRDPVAADMAGFVVNLEDARKWYGTGGNPQTAVLAQVSPVADYVIITTSTISSSSTELANLRLVLEMRGFVTKVVTESDWGGGIGTAAAENIRNWLKSNYLSMGIRYALLVGNPDPGYGDVPMKMLWPRRNESSYRDAPSDYCYSDLTGNWDLDGDGYGGEYPDDFGPGGVDRLPEIYVGRIPVYGSIEELDHILAKTIDYQSRVFDEWARSVLLPMKALDSHTPSYQLGENIRRDVLVPNGFNPIRIYDHDYALQPPPEREPCDYVPVLEEWNSGAGTVVWMSHGSTSDAGGVIDSERCSDLDDAKPSIVYAGSCSNGAPEVSDNLAHSLLKRGAVATVAASRAAWYYVGELDFTDSDSIGGLGYQFARSLLAGQNNCAKALMDAKLTVPLFIWPNHLVANLYGDPSLELNRPVPGSVCGRVFDVSGRMIAGALIRSADDRQLAKSQYDGSYLLRGMNEGTVSFSVSADGYHTRRVYDVPVTCGTTANVNVLLEPAEAGSLSGYVYDELGYPVADALVEVVELVRSAQTTENGYFAFPSLPPGAYTIRATKSPFAQVAAVDCAIVEGLPASIKLTLRLRSGNALLNGGFERGFVNGLGVFWQSYTSPNYWGGPAIGSDHAQSGLLSQQLLLPSSGESSFVGVFQTANVVAGKSYFLVAWKRDHFEGQEEDPSDNITCRFGYDQTGGTDPASPTVEWRDYDAEHDVWRSAYKHLRPTSSRLTIFLEAHRKSPASIGDCTAWFDSVSVTGPVPAPPVPKVTVQDRFQTEKTTLAAGWSCGDADVAAYEYALSSTGAQDGILVGGEWTNVGVQTSAVRSGLQLKNGDIVRVLVRARNASGTWSEIGCSEPVRIVEDADTPAHALQWPDETWVRIRSLLVSRTGEGTRCFLQAADRSSGVEAVGRNENVPILLPGTVATVVGRFISAGASRILVDAIVMPTAQRKEMRPLGMKNLSVGGGSSGYSSEPPVRGQVGSQWGLGPNNVGLLVTVVGRVIGADDNEFTITDGSLPTGLRVRCFNTAKPSSVGAMVRVTGISTPDGVSVFGAGDVIKLL